jgi:hypothetical protein
VSDKWFVKIPQKYSLNGPRVVKVRVAALKNLQAISCGTQDAAPSNPCFTWEAHLQLRGTTDGFNETACHITDLKHHCSQQDGLKRKGSRFVATGNGANEGERRQMLENARAGKWSSEGHQANSLSLLSGAIDL